MNKNRFIGKLRVFMGFCPACNSDSPFLYYCHVCQHNNVPKKYWWKNFVIVRKGGGVPNFRSEGR